MNMRQSVYTLFALLLAAVRPALAEDIDLFANANGTTDIPQVLFVIDNAANFSANASGETCIIGGTATALSGTVGGIEQCALYEVISNLDPGTVNIGIMVYNANNVVDFQGVQCVTIVSSKPGGCLVYPMSLMNASNKTTLLNWIRTWKTSGSGAGYIKANSEATGGSMQEAWAYYNGRIGLSGRNYSTDKPAANCKRYIIFIGNSFNNSGSPGDQTGNAGPAGALNGTNSTAGMNANPAATSGERTVMNRTIGTACGTATLGNPHENKGYYMDEWARYMKAHDITTYTIGVIKTPGCQADYAAVLKNSAKEGGGDYYETKNKASLIEAIKSALAQMLSKNSAFASAALPVSVNPQGYYLNQVYIGMFRPDSGAKPRWFGNLKQYRLGRPRDPATGELLDTGLELQDSRDPARSAISPAHSGFIWNCARSYWTPSTADTYWSGTDYTDTIDCEGYAPGTAGWTGLPGSSNSPDGDAVEKGAQAYRLRAATVASRNLMTCDSSCSDIDPFDTTNSAISKAALGNGSMTDTERTDLINWARGLNNLGDETTKVASVASTAMRPSVHGDVVHSRPVALDYGTADVPNVAVFYGANDGILRAVNGNRTATFNGVAAGDEIWSFMAPEFFGKIARLRSNSVTVDYFGNPILSPAPQPKPYGFDGAITADVGDSHKWLFATMRRGGRAVYAFDVTDLATDVDSPTLKWRIGCDSSGCTSDTSNFGQAWSTPKVIRTLGYGSGTSPMLIMGGGYDTCEDADPMTCTSSSKGASVFVIDADDGDILKEFDLSSTNGGRGVVADVFVVPDGTTGRAKWAYAVDTGGSLWRISGATANEPFGSTAPEDWTITRVAYLGCDTVVTSCTYKRKFLMMPDIVEKSGVYYILFGSGDREKPLLGYTNAYEVENHFFAIKDVPTDPNWLTAENTTCSANLICKNSLVDVDDATPDELATAKGWYLNLEDHEQVVTTAITVFGITTFSTHIPHVPDADECVPSTGTAKVYNIRFYDASPKPGQANRSMEVDGGGLSPSPVAGEVKLDDGSIVPFLIGGSSESSLEGEEPTAPSSSSLPKSLTYWFIRR